MLGDTFLTVEAQDAVKQEVDASLPPEVKAMYERRVRVRADGLIKIEARRTIDTPDGVRVSVLASA